MAEKLVYYLLALTLAGGFFLVYGIVATELRSKRESQDRQKLRAAYSDIKRLHASESTEADGELRSLFENFFVRPSIFGKYGE